MSITPLYELNDEARGRIIRSHLEMPRGGKATGPIQGAYGEVYSLTFPDNVFPNRVAAKCPRIKRFGTSELARVGVEQALHELEKTHTLSMVPWVNRLSDVQIIHGWPFILSRYRDGTLEDLIANPLAWSLADRFASLIQIVRALRLAQARGIVAHQDLKPGNVFFDDLSRQNVPKESTGMHFRMLVGDFGLADAFKEFGRNSGTRPYMAPEQFSETPFDPGAPASFDVFALGVIAFESFTDGQHPIGLATAEVWPPRRGVPQKWNRKSTWQKWAETRDKSLSVTGPSLPTGMEGLILASLSPDPSARPSLEEFENQLWDALHLVDSATHASLRMQVEHIEGFSSSSEWPHMEERLMQLRQFYSEF